MNLQKLYTQFIVARKALYDILMKKSMGNSASANSQKVYEEAKACLGKSLVVNNATDGYGTLGCAESVNRVFSRALGNPVGGQYSTNLMYQSLKDTSRFDSIPFDEAIGGDVCISPTGYGYNKGTHGHVGIFGNFGIMSNNSEDGIWSESYTKAQWKHIYGVTLGFPLLAFRIK